MDGPGIALGLLPSRQALAQTTRQNIPVNSGRVSTIRGEALVTVVDGGADGIRTHYLLTASQTLSRLSYSPNTAVNITKAVGELKLDVYTQPL
jgi:hypothetical protein